MTIKSQRLLEFSGLLNEYDQAEMHIVATWMAQRLNLSYDGNCGINIEGEPTEDIERKAYQWEDDTWKELKQYHSHLFDYLGP